MFAKLHFDSQNYFCRGARRQDISLHVLLPAPFVTWGGFHCELGGSILAFFARETNSQLTSASLKGAEDLSGELFYLTLVLSLVRGGVLSRTYLSARKASSAWKINS